MIRPLRKLTIEFLDYLIELKLNTCKNNDMKELLSSLGTKVLFANDFADLSYHVGTLPSNSLWVCDSNTCRMVRPLPTPNVVIEAGEASKSFSSIEKIISTALDNNLGRDCTFIALGGGMICDICTFAASIYVRGCKVVLIPTTVISMTDSCIGSKSSINFRFAKNIVGSYFSANEALICIDCLRSLSNKDYLNGFAPVLKHSLLTKDDRLFNILASKKNQIIERDSFTLKDVISLSLFIKNSFIESDMYERQNKRLALNLGNNFAHALISLSRLQWSYSQAIAWGVCKAAEASRELGLCSRDFTSGVLKLFAFYGFETNYKIQRGDWMDFKSHLIKNRKSTDGKLSFVLLKDQGEFVSMSLDDELIKKLVMQSFI